MPSTTTTCHSDRERLRVDRARELRQVEILTHYLDALVLALRVEHPALEQPNVVGDPPSLKRARAVLHIAAALRGALNAYGRARHDAVPAVGDHDTPR